MGIINFYKKKSFILISLLLISLVVLSGCGGSSGDSVTETATVESMSTTNSFLNELKQGNTDQLKKYVDNETCKVAFSETESVTIDEYITFLEMAFASGAKYDVLDLQNATTELVASDEVKITGTIKSSGTSAKGDSFESSDPAEITVNNFGGSWLITKLNW